MLTGHVENTHITGRILRKLKSVLQEQKLKHYKRRLLKLIPTIMPLESIKDLSRTRRYIISLTASGKRLTDMAPYAIITLLNQKVIPDKIVLWVGNNDKENIPHIMEKLVQKGLEIHLCGDIEFVPIIETFPDYSVILANANVFYQRNWFEKFFGKNSEDHLREKTFPPYNIPTKLKDEFTMNGTIPVINFYFDDRTSNPVKITRQTYNDVFSQLNNKVFRYYGDDVWSFYDAFADYPLENKTVLIFGLNACNCEAMAVWKNAKKVYVVDYNRPTCEHEKIEVLTHAEVAESGQKFDIGISFSSFEHDGLGRYGDPISPDADLKAMQYAKSLIKEDGFLFLGVPSGKDTIVWNAHRIYGEIRFPILIMDWLCLDVYHTKSVEIFDAPIGSHVQPIFVLKNVSNPKEQDFADRINHAGALQKQGKTGTRDGALLEQILKMQVMKYQKQNTAL